MEDKPVHAHANYKKLCYTTFYDFCPYLNCSIQGGFSSTHADLFTGLVIKLVWVTTKTINSDFF